MLLKKTPVSFRKCRSMRRPELSGAWRSKRGRRVLTIVPDDYQDLEVVAHIGENAFEQPWSPILFAQS